jgi:hypothetical protein
VLIVRFEWLMMRNYGCAVCGRVLGNALVAWLPKRAALASGRYSGNDPGPSFRMMIFGVMSGGSPTFSST